MIKVTSQEFSDYIRVFNPQFGSHFDGEFYYFYESIEEQLKSLNELNSTGNIPKDLEISEKVVDLDQNINNE